MNITTRNLHEHTAQEVFDFVCTKVLEQGRPSMNARGCRYRSDDGDKCAFGHVIDDSDYRLVSPHGSELGSIGRFQSSDMNQLGWRTLDGRLQSAPQDRAHYALLADLQHWHDSAASHVNLSSTFNEKFIFYVKRGVDRHKVNTQVLERFQ